MTDVDYAWRSMDDEPAPPGGGQLRRRLPIPACDVFLTQERPSRMRGLYVSTSEAAGRLWRGLRDSPGLEIRMDVRPGVRPSLQLVERDERFQDVFAALVRDLVTSVGDVAALPSQQQPLLMDFLAARIIRWQTALKTHGDGLSAEKRAGLFGELSMLSQLVAAGVEPGIVVDGWSGPSDAVQDFQHEALAMEVKASRQTQPTNVRISSERQLDVTGGTRLLLVHFGLDERSDGSGMSLPSKVAELRELVGPSSHAGLQFDDRLMDYGYLDVHAPRYADNSYVVRTIDYFDVRDPMPRIVERDLPVGVGQVSYNLSLAACEPCRLDAAGLSAAFGRITP